MAGRDIALRALDKALTVNHTVVQRHVRRMRSSRPDASPAEIVAVLEKQFMAATVTLGMAAGASAAVPGMTTLPALGLNVAEVGTFMEAAVLYALSVAVVLVMAVLMGSSGASFVQKVAGRTAPYWARGLVRAMPMSTINSVNGVLGPRFLTKYGTKQGILVLGRELPFGLGAAIGAGGNALLSRTAIAGARSAFGPPPAQWPGSPTGAA